MENLVTEIEKYLGEIGPPGRDMASK
jgi:hypothetical protein